MLPLGRTRRACAGQQVRSDPEGSAGRGQPPPG